MILILTNKQDVHTDEVIRRLETNSIVVFRLNSEDIVLKYKVSLSLDSDRPWSGKIIDELGRVLDLAKLKVAWFRKPEFDFRGEWPNQEIQQFANSEIKAFIDILYSLPNVQWINDPYLSNKSKVKFQQLILAKKLGIKIPKTLITTRPEEAREFFLSCGEVVIAKAIYGANVTLNGINRAIPSTKVTSAQFYDSYQRISVIPTQFQEYVEKAFELRITTIGQKVFAVKIDSQMCEETKVDWRVRADMIPHSTFKLPEKIEQFCLEFLSLQGLSFGAMDFVVTPAGDYVFLENNPFGQYLWLEDETGLPLTETMCDHLASFLA